MSNEQVNQKSLEIEVSQALNAVFQQMNGQGEMLIGNIIAVSSMADLLIESGIITKEDFEAKVNDNRERVIEEIQKDKIRLEKLTDFEKIKELNKLFDVMYVNIEECRINKDRAKFQEKEIVKDVVEHKIEILNKYRHSAF